MVILPRIHKAFGNLKTWLRGTHHGVDPQHLQGNSTRLLPFQPHAKGRVESLLGLASAPGSTIHIWFRVKRVGGL